MITASRFPRAFTLIEVLLGVLILGLGLLGLASVFPLVVKQQREAQDVVLGVSAAGGAEAVLRGHAVLNDPAGVKGWAPLSRLLYQAAVNSPSRQSLWTHVLESTDPRLQIYGLPSRTAALGTKNVEPGTIAFVSDTGNPQNPEVVLYTSDRLLPQGPGVIPQYVWDAIPLLASRADAGGTPTFSPLRVAIFIRRIDPGIRVAGNVTISDVIASGAAVAIAVDNNGLPTFDGRGSYAVPLVIEPARAHQRYRINTALYNVIEFDAGSSVAELAAVRQVGQQIVDTDGNIYNVVALPDEKDSGYDPDRSVVVSPPLAGQTVTAINGGGGTTGVVQFLVSPVIPASVEVTTIRQ